MEEEKPGFSVVRMLGFQRAKKPGFWVYGGR
jgi:hypothetical protein